MSFATEIRNVPQGKDVWDSGEKGSVAGLHVRGLAKGRRSFMFYYRAAGQQRRMHLGDVGPMTVGEARATAASLAAAVQLGGDPLRERDEREAEARAAQTTVAQLWDLADRKHYKSASAPARSWPKEAKRLWDVELAPTFGATPAGALRRAAVRRWHEDYLEPRGEREAAPGTGNRALAVLRKVFSYAISREHHEGANPCTGVEPHPENERHRYATDAELKKLAAILDRDLATHPHQVVFFWLLAYTGARPSAIARATWDQLSIQEIDGQRVGVLSYVGKTTKKTGQMGRLIIPAPALALLEQLPRTGPQLVDLQGVPRAYWAKVRTEAGCPDLWARDWRKTFATIGLSAGESLDVIGRTLEQRSAQTTLRYASAVPAAQVQVVTTVAGRLDALRRGEK